MNEVNGFTFYRNYFELIRYLPNEERLKMYDAIFGYIFEEIEPEFDGLNKGIWINLKMPLNTSKTNIENGKKGGRTKKRKETEIKPKGKRKESEKKAKAEANNISIFLFLFSNLYISNLNNKDNIYNLLTEYLELRIKNKYPLTETIVKRLINKLNEYGKTDEEKQEIIMNAINGAWKDFYPLKESKTEQPKKKETQMEQLEREIRELEEQENEKTRGT